MRSDSPNPNLPHEFEAMTFMPLRCLHCYAFESDFRHHRVPPKLKFTDEDEKFLRAIETNNFHLG